MIAAAKDVGRTVEHYAVIRLLDGTRAYVHAVIDNFSRRILASRVADTFAPVNSAAVLLDASPGATPSDHPSGVGRCRCQNVNAQVDALISTGVLRRVLTFTELKFSNSNDRSMVALPQTSVALPPLAGQRDHGPAISRVLRAGTQPGAATFGVRGQTPDEMYFGRGDAAPTDLTARGAAARRARAAGLPIGGVRGVPINRRRCRITNSRPPELAGPCIWRRRGKSGARHRWTALT
jgi:hypothetical protein